MRLCYSGPLSFSFFWMTVLIKSPGHKVCQSTNSYVRTACLSGRGDPSGMADGQSLVLWLCGGGWGVCGGIPFSKDAARRALTYQKKNCHLCICHLLMETFPVKHSKQCIQGESWEEKKSTMSYLGVGKLRPRASSTGSLSKWNKHCLIF